MAHQQFAGLAVLVALTFLVLAVSGCANTEQVTRANGPMAIAAIEPEKPAVPEFHGASIGADSLRSRLQAE